jgi:hypothetical protein
MRIYEQYSYIPYGIYRNLTSPLGQNVYMNVVDVDDVDR